MAGASSRFFAEGWDRPKYELAVGSQTLFELSVRSFARYFASEAFLFVVRRDFQARPFVAAACRRLGIMQVVVVELDAPTRGQAHTVALGLEEAGAAADEPLTIFNIDTVRPGFTHPETRTEWDGYLEVFEGDGSQWSFVEPMPGGSTLVRRTTEKLRISALCCTGLYYFAGRSLFDAAYRRAAHDAAYVARWRELYIAPLYNLMIEDGLQVHYRLIPRKAVLFSGTPGEYRALCVSDATSARWARGT
jgi:hypothetical protein